MGTYDIVATVIREEIYLMEIFADTEQEAVSKFLDIPEEQRFCQDNLETSLSKAVITSIVKTT